MALPCCLCRFFLPVSFLCGSYLVGVVVRPFPFIGSSGFFCFLVHCLCLPLHFLCVFTVYKLLAHIILKVIEKVKKKETKKPINTRVSPCLRGCFCSCLRIDIIALSAAVHILPPLLQWVCIHPGQRAFYPLKFAPVLPCGGVPCGRWLFMPCAVLVAPCRSLPLCGGYA